MELAKVTSKGQITIPLAIRKQLGVREGDKVLFVEENGKIVLMNASLQALLAAQKAFSGVAEEIGAANEEDVTAMVNAVREERSGEYHADHA